MFDTESLIPKVTDSDIEWVCSLMGLDSIDDARRNFLTRNSTLDVSACPGSGKTTLIVAKLAILAKKWHHRTKGICVLSHTNVAREQVKHKLVRTNVGQRLLGYPHFIGTIHSFVNRFFALPWLYSNGYPSPTIDDDRTTKYRHNVLSDEDYRFVQTALEKRRKDFSQIRICSKNLEFDLGGEPFPYGSHTPSFKLAKHAVDSTAEAGYFCHDEMFVWAHALLECQPKVPEWLAHRFPVVILDEMQDTTVRQACFLNLVFPQNSTSVVVQRIGDPNQEIFLSQSELETAKPFSDSISGPKQGTLELFHADAEKAKSFPDCNRCLAIPNSFRFGPEIAKLASPFAVHSVGKNGLHGIGPTIRGTPAKVREHAIFLFPDDCTDGVLKAYAKHALIVLGDGLLGNGVVTAVGHIHKNFPEVGPGHAHYPKTVGDYWNGYSAELSLEVLHPQSFVQYIRAAQGITREGREFSPGVEKIASGIIAVAKQLGEIGELRRKSHSHAALVTALADQTIVLDAYREILRLTLVESKFLTRNLWHIHQKLVLFVAKALCTGETNDSNAKHFLSWPSDDTSPSLQHAKPLGNSTNTYRFSNEIGTIDIRLGTIHSVKGQTHLATLLLSTHWFKHSGERILPWLLGEKSNGADTGEQDIKRLRVTYVAMTRPSHLLCLAIPRSFLGAEKTFEKRIEKLLNRSWRVAEIVEGEANWRH